MAEVFVIGNGYVFIGTREQYETYLKTNKK